MTSGPERSDPRTQRRVRLAYLVSHPIQYQAPLLRRIAEEPEIDLTVFFGSDFSVRGYRDEGFGVGVKWDIPLLDGYRHEFLPKLRDRGTVSVASPLNYGIVSRLRGEGGDAAFDALWVHGYATVNAMHGILAAKALGIPVLLRAEAWLGDRERSGVRLAIKRAMFAGLRQHGGRSAADREAERGVLAAPTLATRSRSFRCPTRWTMATLPNARARPRHGRASLQAELGLDPARPVILFASKLQTAQALRPPDRGVSRGFAHEAGADPHAYLVIVGDGAERAALERQAAATGFGSIRFCGFRNQSELPRFFDLATVFVLPSRHEPWGLIVNEVMNAARPAIVSDDVGCAPDLIEDGVNGCIVPVGDVGALARALERVLEPGVAEAMGQRAFERIQSWSFEEDVRGLRQALAHVAPGFVA